MAKTRLVLTFPPEKSGQPITYHLVKDFDLEINIIKAMISPNEEGKLVIDLCGKSEDIDAGLKFLKNENILVEPVSKEIIINESECINCGCCVAVCRPRALNIGPDGVLVFNKEKCILCDLCVKACPMRIIEAAF